MTLEDKLLDRYESLAKSYADLLVISREKVKQIARLDAELADLRVLYNQVCSAHDQLVERWRLSEDKPKRTKRKGKP